MNTENDYIKRIEELEEEVRLMKREVRLMKLRRHVTPHFLFNSLTLVMSLIMQEPVVAVKFIRHLANIYRYLLTYGDEYHVPVEQEMELMQDYYELMSVRHMNCIRLKISQKVKNLRGYPLPPMALQGLLENAIKHNVHTEDNPLVVVIDTDGKYLSFSNKISPLVSEIESTKTGLAFMNETMFLLFGREMEVENDGTTFTVRIPLIKEKS
ncbi:MAG: histidine kinase [Bacteroidaceae bacterium]|jgi:LytS/YehU family sensor histidine kinase|nr:histidine kinase [Bacteroidaceae bacterium]